MKRSKKYVLYVAFAQSILLCSTRAHSDGNDPSVIHGCVSRNGKVTITDMSTECKKGETSIHWPRDNSSNATNSLTVLDSNSNPVGRTIGTDNKFAFVVIEAPSPVGPIELVLWASQKGFQRAASGSVYYKETGCAGAAYVSDVRETWAVGPDTMTKSTIVSHTSYQNPAYVWFPKSGAQREDIVSRSLWIIDDGVLTCHTREPGEEQTYKNVIEAERTEDLHDIWTPPFTLKLN